MLRARLLAVLTSLLVLWPSGAPAHARYFCRMMDRVLDSCCCAGESGLDAVHSEAEARSPDCCVRLTQGALPVAEARHGGATPSALPALPAASESGVAPAPYSDVLVASRTEEQAVLARGPPLFLKHCALLI